MSFRENRAFLALLISNALLLVLSTIYPPLLLVMAAAVTDFVSGPGSIVRGLVHLITHQFAHAGLFHFTANFLFFTPIALYLEPRIGSVKFLWTYLLSGVGGLLLFMVVPRLVPWDYCLGASGAISGMYAYAICEVGRKNKLAAVVAFLALCLIMYEQLIPAIISCVIPLGVAFWGHLGGQITAVMVKALSLRD